MVKSKRRLPQTHREGVGREREMKGGEERASLFYSFSEFLYLSITLFSVAIYMYIYNIWLISIPHVYHPILLSLT